ncbi:MAG: CopD family protein [Anaerolineae bacterium]|nr:CopD family protein [Anaerolineae bacterium]MDW8171851.1 CopD family protein [Anaerolineae bacterium]
MNWTSRLALLSLLLALLSWPVAAHGYIVRSIPENRSVLQRSPTRLQYWFSEDLEARFSALNLRDQDGNIIASGGVDADNAARMSLQLPPGALSDGAYLVELRAAFASDGHAVVQTQVFFVGQRVEGVQAQDASDQAQPLEVVWKVLLLSGTYLLFGAFMLYTYVLIPAWGSARHPQGLLPPRVMARLNVVVGLGLTSALLGQALSLLQQTMVFFDVSAERAIFGGLWQIVRGGSRFGDVWTLRLIGLGLVLLSFGASLAYREKMPRIVQSAWTANTWTMALVLGASAVSSHAAGALVMPWVAIAMHWFHALAVAFWIGGLAVLTLILPPALAPYEGEARRAALSAVMRRYSVLVYGAALATIASGAYNAANWFYSPQDLVSSYGGALALKLLMVAGLLLVAALHHLALHPDGALARSLKPLRPLAGRAASFGATLRLEAVLGLGTLALASLLSATPIPQPAFLQDEPPAPSASATIQTANGLWEVSAQLIPGAPGVNTLDVVVKGATSFAGPVLAQWDHPTTGARSPWQSADAVEDGLFVASTAAINAEGEWLALIDLGEGLDAPRAALRFSVRQDAAVLRSLPPSLWNIVPAVLATLTLGLILRAPWQALYRRLSLGPQTLLMALGMTVISAGAIAASIWWVAEQSRQADLLLAMPPTIVNPSLPDQDSLTRGKALYEQHCIAWQSVTDFRALTGNAERLRDEDLFIATYEGWRRVPPCHGDLSAEQRWDIVNYFRRLARVLTS